MQRLCLSTVRGPVSERPLPHGPGASIVRLSVRRVVVFTVQHRTSIAAASGMKARGVKDMFRIHVHSNPRYSPARTIPNAKSIRPRQYSRPGGVVGVAAL